MKASRKVVKTLHREWEIELSYAWTMLQKGQVRVCDACEEPFIPAEYRTSLPFDPEGMSDDSFGATVNGEDLCGACLDAEDRKERREERECERTEEKRKILARPFGRYQDGIKVFVAGLGGLTVVSLLLFGLLEWKILGWSALAFGGLFLALIAGARLLAKIERGCR